MGSALEAAIGEATGAAFSATAERAVGGGCINAAAVVEGGGRRFFVKTNRRQAVEMFAAEAEGLEAIVGSGAVRAPRPICHGTDGDSAFLVLEYLELHGASRAAAEQLGHGLAAMHRCSRDSHGWHRDNTIGATPQHNAPASDWVTFYREQRLLFQLELAARKGHGGALQRDGERLAAAMDAFFTGYAPTPSLLHGDLWSGNYAANARGEPVIFDPAVYYGDREADLAMTELFGGFPSAFYSAYRDAWPLDPGYAVRRELYNLYHVLNHLNLFGGGYAGQARSMIGRLLAAC